MADILSQEEIDALLSTVADTGLKDEAFSPEVDFVPKKLVYMILEDQTEYQRSSLDQSEIFMISLQGTLAHHYQTF